MAKKRFMEVSNFLRVWNVELPENGISTNQVLQMKTMAITNNVVVCSLFLSSF